MSKVGSNNGIHNKFNKANNQNTVIDRYSTENCLYQAAVSYYCSLDNWALDWLSCIHGPSRLLRDWMLVLSVREFILAVQSFPGTSFLTTLYDRRTNGRWDLFHIIFSSCLSLIVTKISEYKRSEIVFHSPSGADWRGIGDYAFFRSLMTPLINVQTLLATLYHRLQFVDTGWRIVI